MRRQLGTLTPERIHRYIQVLKQRTRYCTVLIEDIGTPHNVSAILRTCDGLGLQDIHIFEEFRRTPISHSVEKGSSKWLTLYRYQQSEVPVRSAIARLRGMGYRIVATTPHCNNHSPVYPAHFNIQSAPFAVLLGNEFRGLSAELLTEAEATLHVPLYGFVESYNISVAAAMILYPLVERVRTSSVDWQLSATEQFRVLYDWLAPALPPTE